jgi:hypothetical protein
MDRVPDVNAWRPNGEWQSFHFKFTAAKWEGEKIIGPARATAWWNGLVLQEHGQDVRFRNIGIIDFAKETQSPSNGLGAGLVPTSTEPEGSAEK